jgi:hypothetical protein
MPTRFEACALGHRPPEMAEEKRKNEAELDEQELEEQDGELLPDREGMSIIAPPELTLPVEPPT